MVTLVALATFIPTVLPHIVWVVVPDPNCTVVNSGITMLPAVVDNEMSRFDAMTRSPDVFWKIFCAPVVVPSKDNIADCGITSVPELTNVDAAALKSNVPDVPID